MKHRIGRLIGGTLTACVLVAGLSAPVSAADTKRYNIASLADFSGPFADIIAGFTAGREATLRWWNAEVGADLGVAFDIKHYDTRYDPAQVASIWPGIKSELQPIAVLGMGGPDSAALQERLPDDGIPMFMGSVSASHNWRPEPWVFYPRPTFPHEAAAFLEWYAAQGHGPLRVAVITSEASPTTFDIAKGLEAWAPGSKDVENLEVVLTELQPADLTAQIRRLVRNDVQVIVGIPTIPMVVATVRGLQAMGREDIPIVLSAHSAIPVAASVVGGIEQLEGDYEAYGAAIPNDEPSEAHAFYDQLVAKYGLDVEWTGNSVIGIGQTLYTLRAIERAIAKVGVEALDGHAVREAVFEAPISSESTFGFTGDLNFSRESSFPLTGTRINIATVKDGAYVVAARGIAVPELAKW